jgi:hypothetical protein
MYPVQLDDSTWPRKLLRAPRGKPYGHLANIFAIVQNAPEFHRLVIYDETTNSFRITRSPPGNEKKEGFPRPIRNDDITWMKVWLQGHDINARSGTLWTVLRIVAQDECSSGGLAPDR